MIKNVSFFSSILIKLLLVQLAIICVCFGCSKKAGNQNLAQSNAVASPIANAPKNSANAANMPAVSSNPLNIGFKLPKLGAEEKSISTSAVMKYVLWNPQIGYLVKPNYLMQQNCVSNKPVIAEDFQYSGTEDIIHVCFTINENLLSENSFEPLKNGSYQLSNVPGELNKISEIKLRIRYKGEVSFYTLDKSKARGYIFIEYSDKKRIKGKIDLSDEKLSLKGDFDAEMQQKPAIINSSGF